MAEEDKGSSGAPEQSASGDAQETQANQQADTSQESGGSQRDVVKYDTYKKVLSEAKSAKQRLQELEEKLTGFEQEKLEAEGKKDELIEKLRSQNSDLNKKLGSAVGNFARSKAHDAIVDEAVKMGCTSTKLLKKFVDSELETLEYGDDFSPDREQIKALLERVKQEEPVLFNKPAPKVKDGVPQSVNLNDTPDYSKMSTRDLAQMIAKLDRNKA